MSWQELVAAIASSVGVSAATAAWLGKRWIDHRLTQQLEQGKVKCKTNWRAAGRSSLGGAIGFDKREFPIEQLLQGAADRELDEQLNEYAQRCRQAFHAPL